MSNCTLPCYPLARKVIFFLLFTHAVDGGLEEAELGRLDSLVIEAGEYSLSYFSLPGQMSLLAMLPSTVSEGSKDGTDLPGETVLREAIMKKVLEELAGIQGVLGNVVTSSDGLPIDMQLNEDINPEFVGVILTQAIGDVHQEMEFLALNPIHQCRVHQQPLQHICRQRVAIHILSLVVCLICRMTCWIRILVTQV